ncbi:putative phosphatidylinositol 4-kinase STT4 like protein [Astathelohania contejeani]|uniref:1-phosphatidylinositol 4-kinase n=1 Tax=Astathelohania contejeani TaxID=164912 RepID=A0ABQ7I106_9MICR|nr:putative phosphatidylinositol 4-kinase STT4 like protein [Thelohania contejeani]
MNLFEYKEFQESNQPFSFVFDRKIKKEDILEILSNISEPNQQECMYLYCLIRSAISTLEYDPDTYNLFYKCFMQIYAHSIKKEDKNNKGDDYDSKKSNYINEENNNLKEEIFINSARIPSDTPIQLAFKTASMDSFLSSKCHINKTFEETVIIMANDLNGINLLEVFNIIEDDILNSKLDYIIMALQFIASYIIKNPRIKNSENKQTDTINITVESDSIYSNDSIQSLRIKNNINYDIIEGIINDINSDDLFKFSILYFEETYTLIKTTHIIEDDIVTIFKNSFLVNALTTGECLNYVNEIQLSKEFMIQQENMADIQCHILYVLSIIDVNMCNNAIYFLFTTDAIIYLNEELRTSVISTAAHLITSKEGTDPCINIIRKIKNTINEQNNTNILIENILELVSKIQLSEHFSELNGYFCDIINSDRKNKRIIELYCDFLILNEVEIPVYNFFRFYESDFVNLFYMNFFRKLKKKNDGNINNNNIINDNIIVDFLKFFLEKSDVKLMPILNTLPYLPSDKSHFLTIFNLWVFILQYNAMPSLTFFCLKTPALIGIANSIFIKQSYLPDVAIKLGLSRNMRGERVAFLAILYYSEKQKLSNFNYSGILEYIQDEMTIKHFRIELPNIFYKIHENINFTPEFAKEYVTRLLIIISKESIFDSTRRIVYIILNILFSKLYYLRYVKEIHILFRSLFLLYKNDEEYLKLINNKNINTNYDINNININSTPTLLYYVSFYRNILNEISKNAPHFYNYIILCVADLSLFGREYLVLSHIDNFSKLYELTYTTIGKIEKFPLLDHNISIAPLWLIDVVFIYYYDENITKEVLNLLFNRLNINFQYRDLYILLRISNILQVGKNDCIKLLKQVIYKGLDFKTDAEIFRELAQEAREYHPFYSFYFSNVYYMVGYKEKCESFPKKDDFNIFNEHELVLINNTFRRKIISDLIPDTTPQFLGYYFDVENLSIIDAITILRRINNKQLVDKALLRIKKREDNESSNILFFIPQLIQTLRNKSVFGDVFLMLIELSKDDLVCHQLIWNLEANLYRDENRLVKDPCYDTFKKCINDLLLNMDEGQRERYNSQMRFFRSLTSISSKMLPYLRDSKEEKKRRIDEELSKVEIVEGVYLPTEPGKNVLGVLKGSGRVLQSHAKVPFMASFIVGDGNGESHITNLIFKFGDDCRQDMLALQLISMFQDIFKDANLDIFLYPYRVIATESGCGVIEVIPNAISRDQMGRERINNLHDYFEYKFGFKENMKYQQALKGFVSSLAGYSLVVYFLNIKDRHNGNIMIDDNGRMIHIDFGFMFEISPGGLNLEVPLKLTSEILDLLGGIDGPHFQRYIRLMVQGFYALRRRSKDIMFMVDSFTDSGLPCYRKGCVNNFLKRFKYGLSDEEVKSFLIALIGSSSRNMRTWINDKYQEITNNIAF